MTMMAVDYPAHLETDVVLRTGRTLRIRPIRSSDRDPLLRFFSGRQSDTLYQRFFALPTPEIALIGAPVDVDYINDAGLVGESGGEIVAVAHSFRSKKHPETAEVAFLIAEVLQGCGVGTLLLERLAELARANGVQRFQAEVLTGNRRMLEVFFCSGFETKTGAAEGVTHVSMDLTRTPLFTEEVAERSQKAAYASMQKVFAPRSVAVIGASPRGGLGTEILRNLRANGFQGPVYAIHRKAEAIDGLASQPSLLEVEGPVDLAVIAVPAANVEAVIDDCVTKGVGAVIVITAGFGETGPEGRAMEVRLLDKVRAAGMRMVGPNCMGVINTDPAVSMLATFAGMVPPTGSVAMSSQSGALGLAVLDYAKRMHIGFSTFISVGNKADVSGNDLIQYWAEDPNTSVILLYLESFGNPKKFGEIGRRVARRKPIVAVKAGRSAAGARAASSHTGALASADAIVGDLFRQAGIIRTDTLEELFDMASLLSQQPLPLGRRVAIVTNAGGPGILAADACEAKGLELPQPGAGITAKLRAFLPAAASVGNPIDMIASASADDYRRTLKLLLAEGEYDAVVVIYIPVLPTDAELVAEAIREVAADAHGKTLIATFMGGGDLVSLAPVPTFGFPERAVAALARATAYSEWRSKPAGTEVLFQDIDRDRLRAVMAGALAKGGDGWLGQDEVAAVLAATGIATPAMERVRTAEEAMEAAVRIGGPVALKAEGPALLHKTESGAVKLGLTSEWEVAKAFDEMKGRLGDAMTGAIVQEMVSGGAEVMAGAIFDPNFGHVLAYGAGGTMVELLADVAFRMHPLTDADPEVMLDSARATRLLRGFRGSPPLDEGAVKETLLRLSQLLTICPEIREIDANPLKVAERGAIALDVRIRVAPLVIEPPSRRVTY